MSYILRVLIALDAFIQALFNRGVIGVTISSRCGTGVAHGHRWALWLNWLLEHTSWIGFGPGHCCSAIENDKLRAKAAIAELSDPVVERFYADRS